jgi:hypothetical protein
MMKPSPSGFLVEAEEFQSYGGWTLDSQFEAEMGSPYLLAHGNGKPVADAATAFSISDAGEYHVWVRAKDWVPGHHPGRFTLAINGSTLKTEFGANDKDWSWEYGGQLRLPVGKTTLTLHDLTGFCGRCDAIFLTREEGIPPTDNDEATRAWRRRLRGLPDEPIVAGHFDVVVVGGGIPGCVAALTAARLGNRVALIQNRPYLGGNASVEIGLSPRGMVTALVDEIYQRHANGDLYASQLLEAETNATVFFEHTVFSTVTKDSGIVSVDARHARSGKQSRFFAPLFIDCSGTAILGLLSGAETLYGQESQAEYGESLAPKQRDNMHHGHTVFFRTKISNKPASFPDVPWATEVAKDYADLGGQLKTPGFENGEGPKIERARSKFEQPIRNRMVRPMTHYWEYGQALDPYTQGENIRDHLLRAIYGTFSNVKTQEPEKYANLDFDHVAFVAGQGQFRRYKGDHVLTETDIRSHRKFPDAVAQNSSAFCIHHGGHDKYDFRLKDWTWDERDGKAYDIPFRCLYSCNINNLMMAGKHMSATHVAGSNTKFMGNGGEHAIATAAAAHLCRKYKCKPRELCQKNMEELRSLASTISESGMPKVTSRL